ncbi:hypothetical protein [Streptomyces erythrochromogenes]
MRRKNLSAHSPDLIELAVEVVSPSSVRKLVIDTSGLPVDPADVRP